MLNLFAVIIQDLNVLSEHQKPLLSYKSFLDLKYGTFDITCVCITTLDQRRRGGSRCVRPRMFYVHVCTHQKMNCCPGGLCLSGTQTEVISHQSNPH